MTVGIIAIVIALMVLVVLYLFTPFGFFNVQTDGEFQIHVSVDDRTMSATMENNSSSHALKQMLERGSLTVNARDYAGVEKVGMLWKGLPANDTIFTAQPGDLVLFMGSSFVVYYERSTYTFTKLGTINNVSQAELKELFGTSDVAITLSLP